MAVVHRHAADNFPGGLNIAAGYSLVNGKDRQGLQPTGLAADYKAALARER